MVAPLTHGEMSGARTKRQGINSEEKSVGAAEGLDGERNHVGWEARTALPKQSGPGLVTDLSGRDIAELAKATVGASGIPRMYRTRRQRDIRARPATSFVLIPGR